MLKLSSLCDSLYQEFFTGKGTLLLDIEVIDEKSHPQPKEGWELYDKKGKLTLKADSYLALVYALSFLGNLSPQEALNFRGRQTPKWGVRALYLDEKIVLTQENITILFKLGFNTLVGDYKLSQPIEGLTILPLVRSKAASNSSRDETLQDLVVKELLDHEKKFSRMIYYTEEKSGFSELNYVSKSSYLSFRGASIAELLDNSDSFGTPLLPSIKVFDSNLPLFDKKSSAFSIDSYKHPVEGWLVEAPKLPEKKSYLEGYLFALGYAQFSGKEPYKLYQSWFKKHYPNQFNEEAHHHLETIVASSKTTDTKVSKQKLVSDLATMQEKWPHTIYAEASRTFDPK